MTELLLLRHAKAGPHTGFSGDKSRPLAEKGLKAATLLGRYLVENDLFPDTVLCSTAKRTQETYEALASQHPKAPQPNLEDSLYLADPQTILTAIRAVPDGKRLMVVGHNPGIAHLAALLTERHHSNKDASHLLMRGYPTCCLARFDIDNFADLTMQTAILRDVLRAKSLPERLSITAP